MRPVLLVSTLFLLLCCGHEPGPVELAEDQYFALEGDYAASHILVSYTGAERADPTITRTREEARGHAVALAERLASGAIDFETLAAESSDGLTAARGGWLGAWRSGNMAPEFEDAVARMEVGEVMTAPVETAFGFHLIRREPLRARHYAAWGFFISFGEENGQSRTADQARALAEEIAAETTPKSFEAMAEKHNEVGSGPIFLGTFTERDPLAEEVIATVSGLDFGAVAGPIPFPNGFAVIQRLRVERRAGAHILISHRDARNPVPNRDHAEARALAERLISELADGERSFEDMAREHSDGPTASHGGLLGTWFRGRMMPAFEAAVDALEIGGFTGAPVETELGFHIIRRDDPDRE